MTKIHELNTLGQSVWYDNMRRSLLDNGELQQLIDAGVTGVTSNPTIFEKAIVDSDDYDNDLRRLVAEDTPVGEIYETLAMDDIRRTADMLRPIYERTDGVDGYVSLEVSPTLAHDTEGTIAEAKRLFAALDRPNVMIKIPATPEGIPAIAQSIGAGININVTLIFSLAQYEAVVGAYMDGLEMLAQAGGDVSKIASVASFFVSRVDSMVDKELEQRGVSDLQGTIAVANAKMAYERFRELFSGARWQALAEHGARVQRPLWASTGTKNPNYSDTLYVDSLIGPDTVNTAPPATISTFLDHGTPAATLESGVNEAREQVERLRDLEISLEAITQQLQEKGVESFAQSFASLMEGIAAKRERLLSEAY
jgi:transaldolase